MNEIVTIIGNSYIEPICSLLEKLEEMEENTRSEVSSGSIVNGYAASVCLLAVACLESYVMRVKFIKEANQNEIDRDPVVKYIEKNYGDFPYISEATELFILRDTLTHNHLWRLSYESTERGMQITTSDKKSTGDNKYLNHVNIEKKTTKKLGLSVIPTKVGKSEVAKVLHHVWNILLFLENKNRNQCYVSHAHHMYRGELIRFGDIINNQFWKL